MTNLPIPYEPKEPAMGQAERIPVEAETNNRLKLELPEGLAFDEWVSIGRRLCWSQQAVQWQIGDWWAFGDHEYGDRAKAAAEGIFGKEFGTLMNMASVTRAFPETSRRREAVPFSHHVEVAPIARVDPDAADRLLDLVEDQNLSVQALRREVQAIRAANEGDGVGRLGLALPEAERIVVDKELLSRDERIVELATALTRFRALTKREKSFFRDARLNIEEAHSGRRKCPDDFDIIFVEKGRIECETWYRASRNMVNRWLVERGKQTLIDRRAAFVRLTRQQGPNTPRIEDEAVEDRSDSIDPALARMAADYLRISRNGGFLVSASGHGDWWVGSNRKTSDELCQIAESRAGTGQMPKSGRGCAANLQAKAADGLGN